MQVASVNRAEVIGNLTKKPTLQKTPEGTFYTELVLVSNFHWKTAKGEDKQEPEYHDIVLWWPSAQIAAKNCVKWQKIRVEGRLQTRRWESEGVKKQRTRIVATSLLLLSGGKPDQDDNIF